MDKLLFYDEKDNPIEFEVQAKFNIDETSYVAMLPVDKNEDLIYILKIEEDENGNEVLVGIEDDELEEAKNVYEELISNS